MYIHLVSASGLYTPPLHTPPFSCSPGPSCSFETKTGRKQEHAQQVDKPQRVGYACSDCYGTLHSFCVQRTCWFISSCLLARLTTPSLPPGTLCPTTAHPVLPKSFPRDGTMSPLTCRREQIFLLLQLAWGIKLQESTSYGFKS